MTYPVTVPHRTARADGSRTQAERRAETERRVLDAALGLIAAGGSRSITLAEVGRVAGYSRGIVTHQFGTRDELLRRATIYAQTVVPSPDDELRGFERILALVDNYLAYLLAAGETVGRAFLLMWAEAVAAEPSLEPIYVERDAWFRAVIADSIADGIADGSIRANADPAALAVIVLGQLRGIGLQLILTPNVTTSDALRRETRDLLRHGLAVSGPPL